MNTPVIEVRNFCKRFTLHQQGGVVINALDNVSFSVSAGECLALSGTLWRRASPPVLQGPLRRLPAVQR